MGEEILSVIENVITLLVGSAVFITAMNMMSSGLKKATGKGLKNMLRKIQNNRFAGLGIGAAVTALIQSSAATSVMVIGFINAGVMTLFQGTSIILGACIGTTITGVLASLSSFSISSYFMILAFIGVVMSYFNSEKVKNIGEILCGLGLIFFGLETMKGAFSGDGNIINEFCQNLFATIKFPILLLIVGALFTALVQSSSATSGIVIVMVETGAIDLSSGFYLILGATIGTTITTVIATIGGNTDVKRMGFIAVFFKVVCAIIALLILWPLGDTVSDLFLAAFKTAGFSVAMFNVIYSALFFSLCLPFIELFVKLAQKVIPEKENKAVKDAILYIDDRLLDTPTIALMQTKREIVNMMCMSYKNLSLGYKCVLTQDFTNEKEIQAEEDKIDYADQAITKYLIDVSSRAEKSDENKVGAYFHVINDIERIGDHAINFLELAQNMQEDDLSFSDHAKEELNSMFNVISKMCDLSLEIFRDKNKGALAQLHELEEETDKMKKTLSDAHYIRITSNQCKVELSPFYTTMITELERIADHITNIGYSIVSPTGEEVIIS